MSADCRRSSSLDAPRSTVRRSPRRRADDVCDRSSEDRTAGSSHAGKREQADKTTARLIDRSINLSRFEMSFVGRKLNRRLRVNENNTDCKSAAAWNKNARRAYYGCCDRDGIAGDNGTERRRARVTVKTEPEPNQTGFDSYFERRARARAAIIIAFPLRDRVRGSVRVCVLVFAPWPFFRIAPSV